MRHKEFTPDSYSPVRRALLKAFGSAGLLAGITGCVPSLQKPRVAFSALPQKKSVSQQEPMNHELMDSGALDQLEQIILSEHKVYEALVRHSVGLAVKDDHGNLTIGGQAVVVPRIGPDNKQYRAVITNQHVEREAQSVLGKTSQLVILPNQKIPQNDSGLQGVPTTFPTTTRLPFVESQRWIADERHDVMAVALAGVRNQSELYSLPSVELDLTPLRPGEIVFCLSWTKEDPKHRGLWVNPGIVMRQSALARLPGREHNPGEVLIAFSSRAGNSGGGVFRVKNGEVGLVGLLTEAYDRAAIGSIIIDAPTLDKFLRVNQGKINDARN